MDIPKAIELNKESIDSLAKHNFPDHADAIKLGNEALKVTEAWRKLHPSIGQPLLPGETPEPPPSDSLAIPP